MPSWQGGPRLRHRPLTLAHAHPSMFTARAHSARLTPAHTRPRPPPAHTRACPRLHTLTRGHPSRVHRPPTLVHTHRPLTLAHAHPSMFTACSHSSRLTPAHTRPRPLPAHTRPRPPPAHTPPRSLPAHAHLLTPIRVHRLLTLVHVHRPPTLVLTHCLLTLAHAHPSMFTAHPHSSTLTARPHSCTLTVSSGTRSTPVPGPSTGRVGDEGSLVHLLLPLMRDNWQLRKRRPRRARGLTRSLGREWLVSAGAGFLRPAPRHSGLHALCRGAVLCPVGCPAAAPPPNVPRGKNHPQARATGPITDSVTTPSTTLQFPFSAPSSQNTLLKCRLFVATVTDVWVWFLQGGRSNSMRVTR